MTPERPRGEDAIPLPNAPLGAPAVEPSSLRLARQVPQLYAALDLGTNSCRMLIAQPKGSQFQVVDSFSKTVQLGVGLEASGRLSRASMGRTIQALRIGFVFYRDAGDPVPVEAVPAVPLAEASAALEKAAVSMSGGGDDAEPVLDAVQYAAQLYDWPADAGKKIIVAVLNDDAKPATTSALDERIPAGIDAIGVARGLFEEGVPVISVQAGPKAGQMLTQVLSALANETSGEFVPWDEGVDSTAVAGALSTVLQERTTKEIDAGREVVGKIYDFEGAAAIPLEVIDGEKLERLREAGIAFNIAKGEDGILVQPGFMIETPDLMEPHVQISKDTLLELINLLSVLSVTGVDSESLHQSVAQSLAAIAGEEVDPAETIAETGLDRLRAAGFDVDIQVDKTPQQLHAILPGASALIVRSATMVDAQMLKHCEGIGAFYGQIDHVVLAQPAGPLREALAHGGQHLGAGLQLHLMALAVVEADGLDPREALQRPGQAGGGILAAGEQHQGTGMDRGSGHGTMVARHDRGMDCQPWR